VFEEISRSEQPLKGLFKPVNEEVVNRDLPRLGTIRESETEDAEELPERLSLMMQRNSLLPNPMMMR
jgi:hypothetical protein